MSSWLSLLGPHLNSENAADLSEASRHKSCEQVEELLAARFPKPDVRDAIRRLPVRADLRRQAHENPEVGTPNGGSALDAAVLANRVGPSNRPQMSGDTGHAELLRSAIPTIPTQQRLEPLSADRFAVRFTADREFRELLEEVRALAGHREPDGDLLRLMKRGLEAYRRELQGCCTFSSEDGRRCSARRFLELDHIRPWAVGGETTVDNLRLRCRGHNQHSARSYFGADFVRAMVSAAGARTGTGG